MSAIYKTQNIFERALGINKPQVRVSKNGKLLIDKDGYVRSNYENLEVKAKLDKQISSQVRLGQSLTSMEES